MKKLEVLVVIAAIAVALAAAVYDRTEVVAHTDDNGFHWFNNAYQYENIYDSTGGGGWAVSSGISDWYSNSLLWVNGDPNATFYEMEYISSDFGDTGWYGVSYVYSNNYTCLSPTQSPPGNCNKSSEPATTAIFYLNTFYSDAEALALRPQVAAHELGHAFGLKHPSSCESILMDSGSCQPHADSVQTHDAELVDLLY